MRLLVLCTHNSARSQIAEGWLRQYAKANDLVLEIHSAGTEKTFVKKDAIAVMAEVGIDLSLHSSKTLSTLSDPWNFDYVLTVCDSAHKACPSYPASTTRLHVSFPDPSGQSLEVWRKVRDDIAKMAERFIECLRKNELVTEEVLKASLE